MFPFSENSAETIGSLGEIKIIKQIRQIFEEISPPAPRGIGDDCAVLPCTLKQFESAITTTRLVTTDSLIFKKHFDETVSPENAGKKLIRRNISDIAAMGGIPADAVLALVMSSHISTTWFERFLQGVKEACLECKIELSGGDVASAPADHFFSATLALTGFSENPLLRTGSQIGDFIFVTGTLGGSLLKKHYNFHPRIEEGRFLATFPAGIVRACIDVTDGLLKDHVALLPSESHAEFDFDTIPISNDAKTLGGDLIERAFCDGEDYELLFSIAGTEVESFENAWNKRFPDSRLSRIAHISAGTENQTLTQRLPGANAYEHFR